MEVVFSGKNMHSIERKPHDEISISTDGYTGALSRSSNALTSVAGIPR